MGEGNATRKISYRRMMILFCHTFWVSETKVGSSDAMITSAWFLSSDETVTQSLVQ